MILPGITAAKPASGGGGYTGPLDIASGAVVAYSQRAMAAAWVSNAITIKRDSDDAEMSFATTASNAVDAAAIAAFIGGGTGQITTWFDQSGSASNVAQSTGSQRPTWLANALNGFPGLVFSNAAHQSLTSGGNLVFAASEYTAFFVIKCTADASGAGRYLFGVGHIESTGPDIFLVGGSSDSSVISFTCGSDDAGFSNGNGYYTEPGAAVAGEFILLTAKWGPSGGVVRINGAGQTVVDAGYGTKDAGAVTQKIAIGGDDPTDPAAGAYFDGVQIEGIIFNSILSAPVTSEIEQNIADFYGIALP